MVKTTGVASDPLIGYPTNYNPGDGIRPRYNTIGSLVSVFPRPLASERTLAIIATGQSTIANWGGGALYTAANSRSHQGNIFTGEVYPMADPVFSCDGTGGSPTSVIGDSLISLGRYDRVTVVNVSFGSTSSVQWASGTGNLATGFKIAWNFLKAHGYEDIVHIHQQGEADANQSIPFATMLANIRAIDTWKAADGMYCPMYVSQTTFAYGWITSDPNPANWTPGPSAVAIRDAQAASWNGTTILQGPDTDTITARGGAHWTNQSQAIACGNLWANIL